jgi:hypothetical protein
LSELCPDCGHDFSSFLNHRAHDKPKPATASERVNGTPGAVFSLASGHCPDCCPDCGHAAHEKHKCPIFSNPRLGLPCKCNYVPRGSYTVYIDTHTTGQVADILLAHDAALRAEVAAWKSAIEGLTPGGSEFVNDPAACAAFIREQLQREMSAVGNANQKRNAAEAKLKTAEEDADTLEMHLTRERNLTEQHRDRADAAEAALKKAEEENASLKDEREQVSWDFDVNLAKIHAEKTRADVAEAAHLMSDEEFERLTARFFANDCRYADMSDMHEEARRARAEVERLTKERDAAVVETAQKFEDFAKAILCVKARPKVTHG